MAQPTLTVLTKGHQTSGSPTTASISPTANKLIVIAFSCRTSTVVSTTDILAATGNGITWERLHEARQDKTVASDRLGVTFMGRNASPSSGTIVFSIGGGETIVAGSWIVYEVTGALVGANAVDSVAGLFTDADSSGTSSPPAPFTISGTPGAEDLPVATLHTMDDTNTIVSPTNYVELDRITGAETQTVVAYDPDIDLTDEFSWTEPPNNRDWMVQAFRILPVAGGVVNTKTTTDNITVGDSAPRSVFRGRTNGDSIVVSDSGDGAREYGVTFSDPFDLTDQSFRSILRNRILSDAATLFDQAFKTVVRNRTLTDAVTLTDQMQRTRLLTRLLADGVVLTDTITKAVSGGAIFTANLSDAINVTDQIQRTLLLTRMFSDGVIVIDEIIKVVSGGSQINATMTDVINLTDGLARQLLLTRQLFDVVEITDGVLKMRWNYRTLGDALGVSDQVLAQYLPYQTFTYSVHPVFGARDTIHLGAIDLNDFGGYSS